SKASPTHGNSSPSKTHRLDPTLHANSPVNHRRSPYRLPVPGSPRSPQGRTERRDSQQSTEAQNRRYVSSSKSTDVPICRAWQYASADILCACSVRIPEIQIGSYVRPFAETGSLMLWSMFWTSAFCNPSSVVKSIATASFLPGTTYPVP